MDSQTTTNAEQVFQRQPFDADVFRELAGLVNASGSQRERLNDSVGEALGQVGQSADGATAFKLAMGLHLVGRHREAIEWFSKAEGGALMAYRCAKSLRKMQQYDRALQELDGAQAQGWDAQQCAVMRLGILLEADRLDEAQATVDKAGATWPKHPVWYMMAGMVHERVGEVEAAIEAYGEAVELDDSLVEAWFRLAYVLDLEGDEEGAIDSYRECVEAEPAHVNALMNLAVLYEDSGNDTLAERCLRQVLAADPNHPRARLFLKDVLSSKRMFIDEDQERAKESRDAILDTPISDFELSVRSRNCLKKMDIYTLGDLLRISEAELLAYKNFGETSLAEIKNMLTQKNLRLGQLLEEQQSYARDEAVKAATAAGGSPDILNRPVGELEFSVRARKCLQRLAIQTLGDLAARTEAELLGAKNFGQTSLNEVKQRLTEFGLSLRKLS